MSELFDIKSKLNFNKIDLTPPDKVLQKIGDELLKMTNGLVGGEVKEYSGPITSYYQTSGFSAVAAALGKTSVKVDIQDKLGKVGDEIKRFEFYLFTPSYNSYKYRLLFVEFGIGNYPVKVVLEDGVAEKILSGTLDDYITRCVSSEEFEQLVMNILNVGCVIDVIQELINVANIKKQERIDKDTAESEDNT